MKSDNKAVLYLGNKTIRVETIDRPILHEGEVLIQVGWCGICGTDLHIYQGHMDKRVTMPQIIGHELSGKIVQAPLNTDLKPGDRVVVEPTAFCGQCAACNRGFSHICCNLKFLGIDTPGAFQQYWNVRADRIHKIPDSLADDLAALIEPLAVAVHDVRRAGVGLGDSVVVIGGGPIGLLIAMVARYRGARVTILEINEFRLKLAAELGFDVIHSQKENPVDAIMKRTDNVGADVVFEVTSSSAGAALMTELVRVRGTISIVGIFSQPVPVNLFRFFWREINAHGSRVYESCDFKEAISLAASSVLPLERIVSERITLEGLAGALERLVAGQDLMKILVECR
jgi:2-desacetyl-2-hydroxyethyl bacteriochlorophyllide A dehydrogenase